MKLSGGHLPRIAGRPSGVVTDVPMGDRLLISLRRGDISYTPLVADGDAVVFGDALAEAQMDGGAVYLAAPATGRVRLASSGEPAERLALTDLRNEAKPRAIETFQPQHITAEVMTKRLARAGLWPCFWSSKTRGMPALDSSERPGHIVVNCVAAEPFRARGKVILRREWKRIVQGLGFLPRLMADYGTIHVVLTDASDPMVRMMREELAGQAWIRFETVPLTYPVERPEVLARALRRSNGAPSLDQVIWVADIQAVAAIGACLAEGMPLHQRIVAVGGPGTPAPRHVAVSIGTPLSAFIGPESDGQANLLLRGGLLTGDPVDRETGSVGYDDDAFFLLPRPRQREFLSFMRPGFDRVSVLPVFASCLTGAPDRHVTSSLRGERRPCISCGLCEGVCPVDLLPQVLHRCVYRKALEEAVEMGLQQCIRCGLCTYVCPSKLELRHEFEGAQIQARTEQAEAATAEAARLSREEGRTVEQERKDEWRK